MERDLLGSDRVRASTRAPSFTQKKKKVNLKTVLNTIWSIHF